VQTALTAVFEPKAPVSEKISLFSSKASLYPIAAQEKRAKKRSVIKTDRAKSMTPTGKVPFQERSRSAVHFVLLNFL
jgi:hypothetical protein